MATLRNVTVSIVRDVANADVTVEFDIDWSEFDRLTNLQYSETWTLKGDDTGQDGDDAGAGDDPISLGPVLVGTVSANGATTTHRTKSRTVALASLDEDGGALPFGDDEIQAVVTLTPRLPAATSRESTIPAVVNT